MWCRGGARTGEAGCTERVGLVRGRLPVQILLVADPAEEEEEEEEDDNYNNGNNNKTTTTTTTTTTKTVSHVVSLQVSPASRDEVVALQLPRPFRPRRRGIGFGAAIEAGLPRRQVAGEESNPATD